MILYFRALFSTPPPPRWRHSMRSSNSIGRRKSRLSCRSWASSVSTFRFESKYSVVLLFSPFLSFLLSPAFSPRVQCQWISDVQPKNAYLSKNGGKDTSSHLVVFTHQLLLPLMSLGVLLVWYKVACYYYRHCLSETVPQANDMLRMDVLKWVAVHCIWCQ